MTINYADKFSPKVAESFKINSLTHNAVNHDYDFMGVDTIKVYSVGTVGMNDYSLTGMTRYGSANELQNTVTTYKLTKDRAFTFTIDKKSEQDTMGVMEVGKALKRQIEQVVIPEIDKYRIDKVVKEAFKNKNNLITITNKDKKAYEHFLTAVTKLLDKGIPMGGCFAYISTEFYKNIRMDDAFIKASDLSQEMRIKGVVGMIEGIPLVHIPSTYFPKNFNSNATVEFILMNKEAVLGAEKLVDYKVHENPVGVNGWLVEGRLRYDAFVLENKKDMLVLAERAGA